MRIKYLLIVVVVLVVAIMLASPGRAKIDPGSIVGIWLLDEGQGDVAKDSSGNENDGAIVGAEWTDGQFGKALEFDGTNHVEIPASETTDDFLDGFTYSIWVKPTSAPPNVNTRIMERDWHNPTIQIGPADFYASIAANADQGATNVRGGAWAMNEWSFVAMTYDGAILQLYVDGEMVNEKDVGKPDEGPNNTQPPHQGAIWLATWKAPGWDFRGALDEAAVFNVPLSAEDIENIMNNGLEEVTAVSALGKLGSTWGKIKASK